jgi:ribosomal protein S18 acetylase RimI-like enzyme
VRPGRPGDYHGLRRLWAEEVRQGMRDCVPGDAWLGRLLNGLDWEANSRVVENGSGPQGLVMVWDHLVEGRTVARLEIAARNQSVRRQLLEWGLRLSRAAGAASAEIWWPRRSDPALLVDLGLMQVRLFWRMDRPHLDDVPAAPLTGDYELAEKVPARVIADTYNLAFADHWHFRPADLADLHRLDSQPDLCLLALAPDGEPAAVVWSSGVEEYSPDLRSQPVGLVSVVGTLPGHRRRGLALSLTAELLRRLRQLGARSTSLYVDALNPTRAFDVYRRLGFEVAYEYDVFEATW